MSFSTTDTIVAIATPPGRGGIGVVRLAGPAAQDIACGLLDRKTPLRPRHATLGRVVEPADRAESRRIVDEVIATWFAAPNSFTGDDVVEISAHGSMVLLRRIVELAIAGGARLGEPGEFTLRAYLNGRMDLVQAEAVADLVDAVTPLQARVAMDQLEGTLTTAIGTIDAALFDLVARLEASLDFPDEGFHFVTRDQVSAEIARTRVALEALIRDGRAGRVLREGSVVVIGGRPNTGKSSLFNALVGSSRAIVTHVPGTTRDLLTERVEIDGVPVTLVDTAGLRDASDPIEEEGVRRAREAQHVAALTIVMLDGSQPLTDEDHALLAATRSRRVVAISKADLPRTWSRDDIGVGPSDAVDISTIDGTGLDELRRRVVATLTSREEWKDPPAVTNVRHIGHLLDTLKVIEEVERSLSAGATEELVLAELGSARESLEAITGQRTPDDILKHIFSKFCVGK